MTIVRPSSRAKGNRHEAGPRLDGEDQYLHDHEDEELIQQQIDGDSRRVGPEGRRKRPTVHHVACGRAHVKSRSEIASGIIHQRRGHAGKQGRIKHAEKPYR